MTRWSAACLLSLGLSLGGAACGTPPEGMRMREVVRADLVLGVEVSGALRSVDSDNVGPPAISGVWNYKIAMMAPEGEIVEQGSPTVMFDTSELQRRLEAKSAERDSAATQLALKIAGAKVARQDERLAQAEAEAELRRATLAADAPDNIVASIELGKARLDRQLAADKLEHLRTKAKDARRGDEAEVQRWKRRRDRAEQRVQEITAAIEAMSVKAERTGTVIYKTDWEGQKRKVGDGVWRAQTVLQVVSLDEMEAAGEVDEVDIARVALEQSVSLRLDAQPDTELRGTVDSVRSSVGRASADSPLKVAKLTVHLDDTGDARLRPGMRFRGTIETLRLEDVLVVPLDAIVPTPDGPVVRQVTGNTWEEVAVRLGNKDGDVVEVLEGLDEGDRVLSLGLDRDLDREEHG